MHKTESPPTPTAYTTKTILASRWMIKYYYFTLWKIDSN